MTDAVTTGLRRGAVQCGGAAVLFGAATPAASALGEHLSPFVLAGILYLGAAAAMLPIARRQPLDRTAARAGASRLGIAVLFGGMIGPVLLMFALDRAPASTVSLLLNLEVVFTVALAAAFFHEHLGPRVVAGMLAVACAGGVLGWTNDVDLRVGALLAACACAAWAIDNTTTANLDSFTPQQITLAKGAVAGAVNLTIGLSTQGRFDAGAAVIALGVGAVGYGASISMWISGARLLGAARGQLIFAVAPFVGAALSWAALDDPVHTRSVLAIALATAGVLMVLRSSHDHAHRHESLEHDHEHRHDDGHHTHDHGDADAVAERHSHRHRHAATEHRHPHVPDLHHRHQH
ncbi:MAG: DMT family transporter [Ilumatobacteraceae bacterium]